jgi:excisionase family DNA binding protein
MDSLDNGNGAGRPHGAGVVYPENGHGRENGHPLGGLGGFPVYPAGSLLAGGESSPRVPSESPAAAGEAGESTLSIDAAAARLSLSPKTIRRMIHRGELPASQEKTAPGGQRQYRIPAAAVERLAAASSPRVDSAPPARPPQRVDTAPRVDRPAGVDCGHPLPTHREDTRGDSGQGLDSPEGRLPDPELLARVATLETALAGARDRAEELAAMNAALHAERGHLAGEVDFLRARVVEAERAAEQQRVLALRTTEALERAQQQLAALPPPKPARRAWWKLWERR